MRQNILFVAVLLLLAAPVQAGVNRWTQIGPPANVRTMAVDPQDPDILHAGGSDEVALSTDRGATWTVQPLPGLLQAVAIRVSESVSSTVYVLGMGTLYRSTTRGASWVQRKVPMTAQFQQDLQVDPRNSNALVVSAVNFCFLGCSGGGVFRSDDGAGSWTRIGFKDKDASSVALHPTSSQIVYAIVEDELFRTFDGGRSWSAITPPGGEARGAVVDPIVPTTVYAATRGGVFRSENEGNSWELIRPSQYGALLAHPSSGSRELFVAAQGLTFSADQGSTWRELSTSGSGVIFGSLWEVLESSGTFYMVTDVQSSPGRIFAYELRLPRRRAARP